MQIKATIGLLQR